MDVAIPCPDCGRISKLPEVHLGRRFKCPGCGAIVAARRPEAVEPYAPPKASIRATPASQDAAGPKGPGWTFHVKVKRDPDKALKGMLKVEVAPRGLVLRKPKGEQEVARVLVGSPAGYEGGQTFRVDVDGREVTLIVAQRGVYGHRLAEDVVGFLERTRRRPVAEDYAIPRPLVMAAYSPFLIAMIGMGGGAIGGGIGGGIAGGLLTANLAIVRKESWSTAARIWACLAVTLVGTTVFGGAVVALVLHLRAANNPPAPEAPRFQPAPVDPPMAPWPPMVHPETPPFRAFEEPKTPPSASRIPGLVGYWPLDEAEGADATDASGKRHPGRLVNGKHIEGIRGGAARFEGDGFLDLGDSADFNFVDGQSFTIAGWFRSPEWIGPLVSFRGSKDGAPVIDITLHVTTVLAVVRQDGQETPFVGKLAGKTIRDDHWHHFALVRQGADRVELYLDGESHHRATGRGSGGPITTDLRAAGSERKWVQTHWPEPPYLRGAIDEICVFKRDLDAGEIRTLAGR